MRKRLGIALVVVAFAASAPQAIACGDKFLLLGRSLRYEEAYAAKHPASVLLYLDPSTGFATVGPEVVKLLQKAGHKPVAVENRAALVAALKERPFDVIFSDISDLDAVDAAAGAAKSKAVVLAVIYAPSATDKEAAEKKYSCVLSAKGKDRHFLAVVNEVMRLREKGKEPDCKKA